MAATVPILLTVGHSNRSLDDFLALLRDSGVEHLVDVRRVPRSRRHPWFDAEALALALRAAGVAYTHAEELGGRREAPAEDGPFRGLEPEWRGYAAHMRSEEAQRAIGRLAGEARARPAATAVMCAEKDPSRCHRSKLGDNLLVRGVRVVHVLGPGERRPHVLHPLAEEDAPGRLVYPPRQGELFH